MTKEKPLSESKICVGDITLGNLNSQLPYYVYPANKLEEASQRLKEELCCDEYCRTKDGIEPRCKNCKKIDKIFGEELSK